MAAHPNWEPPTEPAGETLVAFATAHMDDPVDVEIRPSKVQDVAADAWLLVDLGDKPRQLRLLGLLRDLAEIAGRAAQAVPLADLTTDGVAELRARSAPV